jgi:hypothetical protein
MASRLALAPAAFTGEDPAPVVLEVVCYRPDAGTCSGFEARVRQVVEELGSRACLRFASIAAARLAPPAGVYLSPTHPTVVAAVQGRPIAQSIGELPLRELRALIASALAGCREG